MDLISVIVPVYNAHKTLHRCLGSILNQTHKNIEVITVDDASQDESLSILQGYAKKDSRVRVIANEHAGVSKARNTGLAVAKGDYVQFVDSDDDIEPNMLETMLRHLKKERADVCVCNYSHPCIKNYLGNCTLNVTRHADLLHYVQTTFALVVPWNKLYKRSVLTEPFDETVHFCEDDIFGFANLKNVKRITSIDKKLYNYFVAPPETKEEELSCINKMARDKNFYQNHNTYWYKRRDLLEKSIRYLEQNPALSPERVEEYAYVRIFDFMIWELVILTSTGVNAYGMAREMQNIFNEPDFIKSVRLREKYGVKMKDMTAEEKNDTVVLFTNLCMNACREIAQSEKPLRPYFVCLQLFLHYFMEECGAPNPIDQLGEAFLDKTLCLSEEARYAQELLGKTDSIALLSPFLQMQTV